MTSTTWTGAFRVALVIALFAVSLITAQGSLAAEVHASTRFVGPKANTGTVMHSKTGGRNVLTLSDDFKVPDTPDPHWQVIDSKGNVYLLQKLRVKDDKINKSITLPKYIRNIAKVQIWCALAEVVLGEAAFEPPVN